VSLNIFSFFLHFVFPLHRRMRGATLRARACEGAFFFFCPFWKRERGAFETVERQVVEQALTHFFFSSFSPYFFFPCRGERGACEAVERQLVEQVLIP
jgi:hypothetical protein